MWRKCYWVYFQSPLFKSNPYRLDLKHRRSHFTARFDRIEVLAQNYSIISGKVIDLFTTGHGKFNFTVGKIKKMVYK